MLNKIKETTQSSDDEIASNIIILAKNRPDIFTSTKAQVVHLLRSEIQRGKTSDHSCWNSTSEQKLEESVGSVEAFPELGSQSVRIRRIETNGSNQEISTSVQELPCNLRAEQTFLARYPG